MTIGTPQGTPTSVGLATDVLWNATGDLVTGTGDNTADILPVGTEGQILMVISGNPTYRTLDGGSP